MKCEHCGMEFELDHNSYSRAGHHWCSGTCYAEDTKYMNSVKPSRENLK